MKNYSKIDSTCDQSHCLRCNSCLILDEYEDKMNLVYSYIHQEFEIVRANKEYSDEINNYNLLSTEGKYAVDFIDLTCRLEKLINDIRVVEFLMTKYSVVKINTINEIDYINFHLEVFYHKINTINDVLRLLVNHVYRLGIEEKKCNWNSINQKKDVINPNAIDIIEKYYKSFKSIIHIRDLNTHRNLNVNPSSKIISALLLLKDRTAKQMDPFFSELVNEKLVHKELEGHKKKKIEFIRSSKDTAKYYIDFFNAALLDDVLKYLKITKI